MQLRGQVMEKTIWEKIKDLKIAQLVSGFFVGVIAFLSGLLLISERRRKNLEKELGETTIETIELKTKDSLNSKPLPDIISDDNKD